MFAELAKIKGSEGELARCRWPALQVLPAESSARRTIFTTKIDGILGALLEAVPGDVTILSRYGIPSSAGLQLIRREASAATYFVGDLDPLDITVYLCIEAHLARARRAVKYLGVGGKWIESCRRHALPRCQRLPLGLPVIRMNTFEMRHLQLLEDLVDVSSIVGNTSMDVLREGYKLELEGATNAAFYKRGLMSALRRQLFG